VPDEAVQKFRDGMELSDGLSCMPAELEILERKAGDPETGTEAESLVSLTLHEGKFHQVKRMMEEVGCPVVHLKRLSMGPLKLDATLKPGEYRKLTDKERELLENL
ncbi:MAG: 16S rRNA pseudouridine(516) synthase, partial [Pilosibacter sp.]